MVKGLWWIGKCKVDSHLNFHDMALLFWFPWRLSFVTFVTCLWRWCCLVRGWTWEISLIEVVPRWVTRTVFSSISFEQTPSGISFVAYRGFLLFVRGFACRDEVVFLVCLFVLVVVVVIVVWGAPGIPWRLGIGYVDLEFVFKVASWSWLESWNFPSFLLSYLFWPIYKSLYLSSIYQFILSYLGDGVPSFRSRFTASTSTLDLYLPYAYMLYVHIHIHSSQPFTSTIFTKPPTSERHIHILPPQARWPITCSSLSPKINRMRRDFGKGGGWCGFCYSWEFTLWLLLCGLTVATLTTWTLDFCESYDIHIKIDMHNPSKFPTVYFNFFTTVGYISKVQDLT